MDDDLAKQLKSRRNGLHFYANPLVAINGSLQWEIQKFDVRMSGGKVRLYMRSCVPAGGLECDPRSYDGIKRRFAIRVLDQASGEYMFTRNDMRCLHFALGHQVGHESVARYIFESIENTAHVDPFGYSLK